MCTHEMVDVRPGEVVCRGKGCKETWKYQISWMKAAAEAKVGRTVKLSAEPRWKAKSIAPVNGFDEAWRLIDTGGA